MSQPDHLTRTSIRGLRSLGDVSLELRGLTLLIGENGSGKSSVIEALQLLHRLGAGKLSESFLRHHGGFAETLRDGSHQLALDVEAQIGGRVARYRLALENQGLGAVLVAEEALEMASDDEDGSVVRVLQRSRERTAAFRQGEGGLVAIGEIATDEPLLTAFGRKAPHPAIEAMRRLLVGIEVRPALSVTPTWATRASGRDNPLRESALVQPIQRLSPLAADLAAAYHVLRNDRPSAHWNETLSCVRLGLGPDVEVLSPPDAGAGRVGLALVMHGRRRFATQLSDGTLSYLALVAAVRLSEGRSLLVIDEPDAHLHPALQARVMTLLEDTAMQHPVVLATHSDTLLDCLSDPVASTVVCELDETGDTRLRSLDAGALAQWTAEYRGVGALRADGWLPQVVDRAS